MKEQKEIAFSFQEIDLTEAQNIVAAGDGKYSDLLIMLTQKLPEIEAQNQNSDEKKGFAFGVPNGKEIDEKVRRSLCNTVNLRLRKRGIFWRISYSSNKKLFVCVPRSAPQTYKKHSEPEPEVTGRGKQNDKEAHIEMCRIIAAAGRLFKMKPEEFKKASGKAGAKAPRKAVCVVAYKRNISPRIIAPYLGITRGGVSFNALQNSQFAREEIAKLQAASGRYENV